MKIGHTVDGMRYEDMPLMRVRAKNIMTTLRSRKFADLRQRIKTRPIIIKNYFGGVIFS